MSQAARRPSGASGRWQALVCALVMPSWVAAAPAEAPAAEAPAAPEAAETQADEIIVVTAARTPEPAAQAPVATRVLTRDQVQGAGAQTLAQAVAMQPGMWINRGLGGSEVTMHGLGGKYVLVLVDGQRQLGRINGVLDLERFSTADLEQIEITSGPSSVLYGSDALGGVIHLVRRTPTSARAELSTRYDSEGASDLAANLVEVRRGWYAAALGQWRRAPAYDRDPADAATTISAYDERRADLRVGRGATEKLPRLELAGTYLRRRLESTDALATGAVLDRTNLVEEAGARASAVVEVGASRITASAGAALLRDQFISDQRGAAALDQDQETRETLLEASAMAEREFARHRLSGGLDGLRETLRSPRLSRDGARARLALFAQDRWTAGRFTAAPALRLDVDSQFGAHATPRLSALLQLGARATVRANLGMGYRAPSFKELLLRFENPGAGYIVEGNPDLAPETSRSISMGLGGAPRPSLTLQAEASWNELRSMISALPLPQSEGGTLRFGYGNISRARTLDVDGQAQLVLRRLTLEAGLALTRARDLDADEPLPGVPPWRARASSRWRDAGAGLAMDLEFAVTGARTYPMETGALIAAPRVDVRARVAKDLGSYATLSLGVENALDGGDAQLELVSPRTLYLGLTAAR